MKYSLYIKIFENEKKQKDLEMIYTEDFEWIRLRDKARKYLHLLYFCFHIDIILLCLGLMSISAMIVYPEIIFIQALSISLSATLLIFVLTFNSLFVLKYFKYRKWQAEYEKTYEYLNQMAKIIEKRSGIENNDIRRRIK